MTGIQERQAATRDSAQDQATGAKSSFSEDFRQSLPIVIGNGYPPSNGSKTGTTPPPKTGTPKAPHLPGTGLPPTYHPIPRIISSLSPEFSGAITQSNARFVLARLASGGNSVSYAANGPPTETDTAATMAQFSALGIDTGKLAAFEAASVARSKAFVAKSRDPNSRDNSISGQGGGAARYQAAKRRLLGAAPGSEILLPVQTQSFSHKRDSPSKLDHGPAYVLNSDVIQFSTLAEGTNLGWGPHDEASNHFYIVWNFVFAPTVTSNYKFTCVMWFSGQYLVTVDDRWWNSKNANATLRCTIEAGPPNGYPVPGLEADLDAGDVPSGNPTTVFHADKDNINASGAIQDVEMLVYETSSWDGAIESGTTTLIQCIAYGGVDAKGGGSHASFDFSGADHGIGCPFLRVDRVG